MLIISLLLYLKLNDNDEIISSEQHNATKLDTAQVPQEKEELVSSSPLKAMSAVINNLRLASSRIESPVLLLKFKSER